MQGDAVARGSTPGGGWGCAATARPRGRRRQFEQLARHAADQADICVLVIGRVVGGRGHYVATFRRWGLGCTRASTEPIFLVSLLRLRL